MEEIANAGVVAQRFDANTEPGSRNFLPSDQLLANVVGQIARNGKAETTIQSVDQCIHANDFAVDIAERTTGVTGIDRGVGLEVVGNVITAVAEQFAPALPADHAISEGVIEFKWGADGKSELPDAHGVAVAHLHHW